MKIRATVTIETTLPPEALTSNITPGEISDFIYGLVNQPGGPRLITHAAWEEIGKHWAREWGIDYSREVQDA